MAAFFLADSGIGIVNSSFDETALSSWLDIYREH